MRKTVFTLLIAISGLGLAAQNIEVIEVKDKINGEVQSALSFTTAEGNKSQFLKEWKKLMKQYKGKAGKGDEIVYINPIIPGLNKDTLVIYAIIRTKNVGVEFTAAFELRNGFVSKSGTPEEYEVARKLLYDFALGTTKNALRTTLLLQQKELKKKEKELSNLAAQKKNLEGDIVRYEKQIEQAKADIEKNIKDQQAKQTEIATQKEVIGATEKRLRDVK